MRRHLQEAPLGIGLGIRAAPLAKISRDGCQLGLETLDLLNLNWLPDDE